jgi:hypothetical protein
MIPLKSYVTIISMIVIFASQFQCSTPQKYREGVLAAVGSSILTDEMVSERFALSGTISEATRQEFIKRWIDRELLFQEAQALGFSRERELRKEMLRIERDLIIQKLLERNIYQKISVSEEEIASYYEGRISEYSVAENFFKFNHVVVSSLKEAQEVDAFIKDRHRLPEKTDSLATAKPVITAARNQFVAGRFLSSDITKLMIDMEAGTILPRKRISNKYHFIQLLEIRLADSHIPLKEVRSQIEAILVAQKREELYNQLLDKLRQNNRVEVILPKS